MYLPPDAKPGEPVKREPATLFEAMMGMKPEEWDAIGDVERDLERE